MLNTTCTDCNELVRDCQCGLFVPRSLRRQMRDSCPQCDDGDGHCVFPYYGVAPRDQWGDNFREDPDSPGQGTYLRCSSCGRGEHPGQAPE